MSRRIVTRLLWWSIVATSGCADEVPCEDDCEACADADDAAACGVSTSVGESREALSLPDLLAGRIFSVRAEVVAGAGSVAGSSPNWRARCEGSKCYAQLGASVTLTAMPAPGSTFTGWSGCTDSTNPVLKLDRIHSPMHCSAHFESATVNVRWTINHPLEGWVRAAPAAACDDVHCEVPRGSRVVLTAVPHVGYRFLHWIGCADSGSETLELTALGDVTCDALFFTLEGGGGPRFDGLGDAPLGETASYATDTDARGEVVVGYSRDAAGDVAFRWTEETGLQALGGPESRAHGVSPNGRIIGGSIAKPDYPNGRAGVIFEDAGPRVLTMEPFRPGLPPLFFVTDGVAPLNNGQVYAGCIQSGEHGGAGVCRWTAPAAVDRLWGSLLYAADESGTWVGTNLPGRGRIGLGSVAFLDRTELGYPAGAACLTPHECRSEARAFSADHSVVVGTSRVPPAGTVFSDSEAPLFDTAFVYTAAEGMQRLPDLPDGDEASGAYSVSDDGRVIGGFGTDATGQRAVVWVDRQPRTLVAVLQQAGGVPPAGWQLLDVQAMSADGRTFVGNGVNPRGEPEAFRIVIQRKL